MSSLTRGEIIKLVNSYIGVSGGYLGDFSYHTHTEFYPEFCDLDFDPNKLPGTTRQRFIAILSGAGPRDQAKILRGVLERFPVGGPQAPETRTESLRDSMLGLADRLEGASPVASHAPEITNEIVERAITDAETLLRSSGASSGLDRVHTALHGYLFAVCDKAGIAYRRDASLALLLKTIRNEHPAFHPASVRAQDITTILRTMGAVADALGSLRNSASAAHPNKQLLEEPEAMLAINSARTILHYIDARLRVHDHLS